MPIIVQNRIKHQVSRKYLRDERQHIWRHIEPIAWRLQSSPRQIMASREAVNKGETAPFQRIKLTSYTNSFFAVDAYIPALRF